MIGVYLVNLIGAIA